MNLITGVDDGSLYDANNDRRLTKLRETAKALCVQYNQASVDDYSVILARLLGSIGENSSIIPPLYCDYGSQITIGNHFYANHGLTILDAAEVKIGDNVFIGPHVGLYTAGHPLDAKRRTQGHEYAKGITLHNEVWIGGHSCVLPGVTIGEGTVIGAGSVVTKSLPAHVLAVGNPCRIVRLINDEDRQRQTF